MAGEGSTEKLQVEELHGMMRLRVRKQKCIYFFVKVLLGRRKGCISCRRVERARGRVPNVYSRAGSSKRLRPNTHADVTGDPRKTRGAPIRVDIWLRHRRFTPLAARRPDYRVADDKGVGREEESLTSARQSWLALLLRGVYRRRAR
ncbi:hypothetical protein PR048_015039 [Dryococelus australis]|uniref:Uncharacterized protein n=1 Tax=Dryococelus australis TaxID=614101 RepID=A0ABQ9HFV8_9NEOP|nr:hypothetical protein PR048_015039 [Dryococelus australis]